MSGLPSLKEQVGVSAKSEFSNTSLQGENSYGAASTYIKGVVDRMEATKGKDASKGAPLTVLSLDYNGTLFGHKDSPALNDLAIHAHDAGLPVRVLTGNLGLIPCAFISHVTDAEMNVDQLVDIKLAEKKPFEIFAYRRLWHFDDEEAPLISLLKATGAQVSQMHTPETLNFLSAWGLLTEEQKGQCLQPLVGFYQSLTPSPEGPTSQPDCTP